MGFFDDIGNFMKSAENEILRSKYGVRSPEDAVLSADRIIYGRESDSAKTAKLRPLIAWLNKLAASGNDEAQDALRNINSTHHSFLMENDIEVEL